MESSPMYGRVCVYTVIFSLHPALMKPAPEAAGTLLDPSATAPVGKVKPGFGVSMLSEVRDWVQRPEADTCTAQRQADASSIHVTHSTRIAEGRLDSRSASLHTGHHKGVIGEGRFDARFQPWFPPVYRCARVR